MRALVLPILVPLSTAAILLLAPKRPLLQRWIALAGSIVLLAQRGARCSGGSRLTASRCCRSADGRRRSASRWSPICWRPCSCVAVGIVAVAVTAAAFAGVDPRREAFGYHPLIQILLMGVSGAFLTGDLFNLYVWFEVMLVASFVLMALHRTSAQVEAAFKYVTINLIASSIFLTALGLLYGVAGTLNMADLARIWPATRTPGIDMVLAVLFVIAFSIKAGLFPLFFWLPASYHTPPAAIGAVFAGLLTKVGVYALMRIFTLLFQGAPPALFTLLLVMSAATMVIGLVAALNERDFRRILSFNLVGHIGYTTASLSLLTPAALAGGNLLRPPPYRRHHQPLPGQRRAAAAAPHDGYGGTRRTVPDVNRCSRRWRWCRSSRWQVCRRCPAFSASSRSSKARSRRVRTGLAAWCWSLDC